MISFDGQVGQNSANGAIHPILHGSPGCQHVMIYRCPLNKYDDVDPEGDGRRGSREREGGKTQSSCHRSSGFMIITMIIWMKMILIMMIRLDFTTRLVFLGNLTATCETPSPSLCVLVVVRSLPDFVCRFENLSVYLFLLIYMATCVGGVPYCCPHLP